MSRIARGESLSRDKSRAVFERIMTGQVATETLADFLKTLAAKGETADEIAGAADAITANATHVRCDADAIDTCGTGGDGVSTFNVSTTAAIIAAAAGATVAKHGNRTHTRASGSAEAIAALGVNLDAPVPVLERCLRECRIAFLYAPNLHPAMKYAAPARKALSIRTIFNLLGPLCNPAGVKRQLLGVPQPHLADKLAHVLAERGCTFAWVVHGSDLCDLTITGKSQVCELRNGTIRQFEIHPADVGFQVSDLSVLKVDSPTASAAAILAIIDGSDRGPRREHALLNAGAALVVAGLCDNLRSGILRAAEALDDGRAANTLAQLVDCSHWHST